MDTMIPRGKIEAYMFYFYEHMKLDCLPWVDLSLFMPKEGCDEVAAEIKLIRSTEEKVQQIANFQVWQTRRNRPEPEVHTASSEESDEGFVHDR
jgi:hypothetical protein